MSSYDLVLAVALGVGLAAATGFRVFLPMLIVMFWLGEKLKEMYRIAASASTLSAFKVTVAGSCRSRRLVVGSDGHVKARFVDPDFRHRMNIEDILRVIRETVEAGARRAAARASLWFSVQTTSYGR